MKKFLKENWFKIGILLITSAVVIGILYGFNIDLIVNRDRLFKNYLNQFIAAINNKDCEKLYPLNEINGFNKDVICPRGDVGNFMVVDKIDYRFKDVFGDKFSNSHQVAFNVCIQVRGVAAWNEGDYVDCKTDPLIINFYLKNSKWQPDLSNFTDISQVISEAGEKPHDYRCDISGCYPFVGGTIEYFIKTHQLPERGRAH